MKALLVALTFAQICSRSGSNEELSATQISGDWHTIAMAAKDIDMITDYGLLKLFFRHLECIRGCKEMILTFYIEVDDECEKFEIKAQNTFSDQFICNYAGKHQFSILYVSSANMVIFDYYLDQDDNLINVLFLIGKGDSVSREEKQKFVELCGKMRVRKENIRYMFDKDICPK